MKIPVTTISLTILLALSPLAPAAAAAAAADPDALAEAVALAKDATRMQAAILGADLDAAPALAVRHASPTEAALALVARHDASPDARQLADLRALDALPDAQRAAIAGAIDAFLALDDATRSGLSSPPPDPAPVFRARLGLLDAALALAQAFPAGGSTSLACSAVVVSSVLSLDLVGCANTYTQDVALAIDVGGADVYRNNAGGSGFTFDCWPGNTKPAPTAGALLDLAGDDQYVSGRSCGVNGGGHFGSGFLLDAQGADVYAGGHFGVNGGGYGSTYLAGYGMGFLLDVLGDDQYSAQCCGTNGGGYHGVGLLLDVAGNDRYAATSYGANGGASGGLWGLGTLLDVAGDDSYVAEGGGTNGGVGFALGAFVGLLVDGSGTDTYQDHNGGTGTDNSVVPKGLLGAQVDLTHGAAFLHPTVQRNPDGSCWVYNDSNGNGIREWWEDMAGWLLGPLPCTVNPDVGPDEQGNCWLYNDMDGDGTKDWNEIAFAWLPCTTTVNPDTGPDEWGRCFVYNDEDGDGMKDQSEIGVMLLNSPCPAGG